MPAPKSKVRKFNLTKQQKLIAICVSAVLVILIAIGVVIWAVNSSGNTSSSENSSSESSLSSASSIKPEDMTYAKGVTIGGIDVSGKTRKEALALLEKSQDQLRGTYKVTVTYGEDSMDITEDDLVFTFDFTQVLKDAMTYSQGLASESSGETAETSSSAVASGKKDFPVEPEISYENVEPKLDEFTKDIEKDPVDATVVSFDSSSGTFSYKDGKNGLKVDHDKLLEDVMAILKGDKVGTVEVPTEVVEFDKTKAEVAAHMQKLGTFSTYSTNTANGNHNMKLALEAMNGTVLQPGAVFSFNGTTGDTTTGALGYLPAGAIAGGQSIQAYGGGICQASTTLYGAVIRSDLEIVTRYNHLWPSSYVPIGQDATVDYPGLDFQFRNSTDYPVYIQAWMSGTKLTVTLYGDKDPSYDYIEVSSQKTETIAQPDDEYVKTSDLPKGETKLKRQGNAGSKATATKIYYKDGQVIKTEALPSSYYSPVSTIYYVGTGSSGNSSTTSKPNNSSSSSTTSKPNNSSSSSTTSKPNNSSSSSTTSKPNDSSSEVSSSNSPDTTETSQESSES